MAIREIREEGDEILRKRCREVEVFDEKLATLIDDMFDTMYESDGVGLAGPQVGILRRVVVIDTREEGTEPIELVNPVIIYRHGKKSVQEGCLSVPGVRGYVERPEKVKVKGKDRYGVEHVYDASDLLAQAVCHEVDHLEGILFIDKVEEFIED